MMFVWVPNNTAVELWAGRWSQKPLGIITLVIRCSRHMDNETSWHRTNKFLHWKADYQRYDFEWLYLIPSRAVHVTEKEIQKWKILFVVRIFFLWSCAWVHPQERLSSLNVLFLPWSSDWGTVLLPFPRLAGEIGRKRNTAPCTPHTIVLTP